MKKLGIILLTALFLSGCGIPTKSEVNQTQDKIKNNHAPVITILGESTNEDDLNIIRDQLQQNGFKVKLDIAPDFGTYRNLRTKGNYDIAYINWTTVTGNPDYAVRDTYIGGGTVSTINDNKVDNLINKAARENSSDAKQTYKELENYLIFKKAYSIPLYQNKKNRTFNQNVLNKDSVRLPKARAIPWETLEYNKKTDSNKRTLNLSQTENELTSLDPIKANDGSVNTLNTNMYIRLVNLTDKDKPVADGSLSRNFATSKDNKSFYFKLRDDVNFTKVKNKKAVDTGKKVTADDVIYSLNRAKDKNAVPEHQTYNLYESIDKVDKVKNVNELENVQTSKGQSIKDALSVDQVVSNSKEVDNDKGKYQVVKIDTKRAFPQVLNYLAHQSAGIVSKEQVSKVNAHNPASGKRYGDAVKENKGKSYSPDIYASGPYIMTEKSNYKAQFAKNPNYLKGTQYEPNISNINVNFSDDPDSALSKLRNGELDMLDELTEDKFMIVDDDKKLKRLENDSNSVTYLNINMKNKKFQNQTDLRRALLYSINQEQFKVFYHHDKKNAASVVTPLVDTGNKLKPDTTKVQKALNQYNKNKNQ
nr:ABC transporter substrate-binding protein [Mammaliicoccus sp. Marseille-Q6498]